LILSADTKFFETGMLEIALPGAGIGALWFLVSYFGILSICEDSVCIVSWPPFAEESRGGAFLRCFSRRR